MIPKCKKVIITDSFPVGAVVEWWSDIIPEGWLICNGQALNKSDYPDLYKAIGDKYTPVVSSTTFNLPNHNGRAPVGVDSNDSDFDTLGAKFGEKKHTLIPNEMPSHSHGVERQKWFFNDVVYNSGGGAILNNAGESTSPSYLGSTKLTGGDQAHNNTQPSIATYFIIKAKQVAVTAAEVVDNLESDSLNSALSAKQGKVLNDKINNIQNSLLDFFYPVGTYYETSVESFDPNTEWGGTWVEDTKGLATVGAYANDDTNPGNSRTYLHLGSIYGESSHILSIDEMPRHRFGVGSRANGDQNAIAASGNMIGREFLGSSVYNSYYTEYLGNDQAHNNTQPSIGVIRWHRIA